MNKGYILIIALALILVLCLIYYQFKHSIAEKSEFFISSPENQNIFLLNGKALCSIELLGNASAVKWIVPEDESICSVVSVPYKGKIILEFYREGTYEVMAKNNNYEKKCQIIVAEVK